MHRLFLALVAAATVASAGSLADRADAMTLGAPAAVRAAVEDIAITEAVHCRSYVHWHPWGYGYGCGPGVVPGVVPYAVAPVVVAPRRAVVVAPRRAVVVAPRRAVVVAPRRLYRY